MRWFNVLVRTAIYAVAWVVGLVILAICGRDALPSICQVVLRLMGVRVSVYGKVDKSAKITAFNHPQRIDPYLLNAVAGPLSGLILDTMFGAWIFERFFDCVLVSVKGGQHTTARLRETLKRNKCRYFIAVNRTNHHVDVGGRKFKDRIGTFKTIAFRMGEPVQPCVIVAKRSPYADATFSILDILALPLNATTEVEMFFLPTMYQGASETPEAFAARAKKAMNTCLHHAWRLR